LFAFLFLLLRLAIINKIPEPVALLLSIIATFVTSTSTQIKENIHDPSSYAQATIIFKILGAQMTLLVFCLNGNLNDYFIAWFFMSSSFIGWVYLNIAGYKIPLFANKVSKL